MKKLILLLLVAITSTMLAFAQQNTVLQSIEDDFLEGIKIFPNPTERYINLSSDEESNQTVSIRIYNLMGHLEIDEEFNPDDQKTIRLDLIDLDKGLYFVNIKSGDQKITRRIYVI